MLQNEIIKPQVSLAANGKSFYWASHFLSPNVAYNAASLYAFCRLLDDMADGDIPNGHEHLINIQNTKAFHSIKQHELPSVGCKHDISIFARSQLSFT